MGWQLPGRVGRPDRGPEALPGRRDGHVARVVDFLRIDIQVQPGRFGDEIGPERSVSETRIAAVAAEGVEVLPEIAMRSIDLGQEGWPFALIRRWVAGRKRRNAWVLELGRVTGGDSNPRPARPRQGREADHVVLDDGGRCKLLTDLGQPGVDVFRALD